MCPTQPLSLPSNVSLSPYLACLTAKPAMLSSELQSTLLGWLGGLGGEEGEGRREEVVVGEWDCIATQLLRGH